MIISSLSVYDIIASIFSITVILILMAVYRPKKNKPHEKYFKWFVLFKIFSAILFVIIHIYIYQGGDTFLYFAGGKFFAEQILNSPTNFFDYLFSSFEDFHTLPFSGDTSALYFIRSRDVFLMSKIVGLFCLLGFKQFMATSIIFSVSFAVGVWKLFEVFSTLYPSLCKLFAYGILFYPTIGIWGSGILKDTIALCATGLIFYSFFIIIERKKLIAAAIYIVLSVLICIWLKPYILYTFIPIMLIWLQGKIRNQIKNKILKYTLTPIVLIASVFGGYLFLQTISESAGKYSLENVQSVAEGFHSWHSYLADTRGQSGYSLGEVEFTFSGILRKSPEAFFVTYYRPFIIGDVRNFATGFEAIQSLILLVLTFYTIFKVGLLKFLKLIIKNNDIRSFMLFALVFGIAVGLTSYNFGALSRYKIPCLPFFVSSLAIIYYLGSKVKLKRI